MRKGETCELPAWVLAISVQARNMTVLGCRGRGGKGDEDERPLQAAEEPPELGLITRFGNKLLEHRKGIIILTQCDPDTQGRLWF